MRHSLAAIIHAANTVVLAERNPERIADFFTSEYVAHLTDGDLEGGHATVRRVLDMLWNAFPDLEVEVEVLVEGEDRVAWQRTLRGIQEGSYRGFPASGREVVWRDMATSRFQDGLIAEDWIITDLAERLLLARKG